MNNGIQLMCNDLLQMPINQTMLTEWKSLPSDKIIAKRTNCAPNVLSFLGLVDTNTGNECNYTSEYNNSGMQPNEIEDILNKYLNTFHGNNKYMTKIAYYNDKLNEKNLNIIQSKLTPGFGTVLLYWYMENGKIKGHAVVLAKGDDGIFIILDPQQHAHFHDIDGIIKHSDTIRIESFGFFCIHNHKANSMNKSQKKTKRGMTKNNSKRGMTKNNMTNSKRTMTNSKTKRGKTMREQLIRKKRGMTNSKTKDDDKMVVDK